MFKYNNDSYQKQQNALVSRLLIDAEKTSIIPMQTDFRNAQEICLTIISFLNEDIAHQIEQELIKPLQKIEPDFHYYRADEMHITIKGVRVVNHPPHFSENDVQLIDKLLTQRTPLHSGIDFELTELAAFSTSLAIIGYCDDSLQKLIFDLNDGLNKIGMKDDKTLLSNTIFFGNITFCRYTHTPSEAFLKQVKCLNNVELGIFSVKTISLVSCNAVCAIDSRQIIANYNLQNT